MTTAAATRRIDRHANVLGVACFAGDVVTAGRIVVERARSEEGGYACLGNAHVLVSARHDPQLRHALDNAWAVFPDGAPVAWLQRRSGSPEAARIAGADVMSQVCELGLAANLRHFLLGSTVDVLARLQRNLERTYPGISIAGSYSPSRSEIDGDDPAAVERLSAQRPHIVWCAFGAPRQELWMSRNAPNLAPTLLVGVGAAFDFIAGTKPRAPVWMQHNGLEWLHRFVTEPRRLGGRYMRTNSEFLLRAAVEVARPRRSP